MRYILNNRLQKQHTENREATSKEMLKVLIESKENPFEEVTFKGSEDARILSRKQAGDVLLVAKQGYCIAENEESTIKKAVERGSHGGDPERIQLQPVLFVTEGNSPKTNVTKEISTIDTAATLYKLMNLNAPDFIDGQLIDEVIESESK